VKALAFSLLVVPAFVVGTVGAYLLHGYGWL
jgi:hypothetical protein